MIAIMFTMGAMAPAAPMAPNPAPGIQIDCTALSAEMQEFASQLSADNRKVFCTLFNDAQRSAAIELSSQPDSMGNLVTADQAVSKVGQQAGIAPPSGRTTGGCPVN